MTKQRGYPYICPHIVAPIRSARVALVQYVPRILPGWTPTYTRLGPRPLEPDVRSQCRLYVPNGAFDPTQSTLLQTKEPDLSHLTMQYPRLDTPGDWLGISGFDEQAFFL